MNNKFKKIFRIISLIIFVVLIAILVIRYINNNTDIDINVFYNLESEYNQRISSDEKVESSIINKLDNNNYSFEEPLVILDPYDASPLTALICFDTDYEAKISIEIKGKDEFSTFSCDFEDINTRHLIPVYALYADTLNEVIIYIYDEDDNLIETNNITIQTEELPDSLQDLIIFADYFGGDYQEGLNFISSSGGKYAIDINGDIRWYTTETDYLGNAEEYMYENGKFIFAEGSLVQGETLFVETDMLGKVYDFYMSDYGAHHEIEPMDNGNLIVAGSNTETMDSVEDFIYEIDVTTGEVINSLDLKEIFQRMRIGTVTDGTDCLGEEDWFHLNAIDYVQDGYIILSSNFQSMIAKIAWPSGEIVWMLTEEDGWHTRYSDYILTAIGDDFDYCYNQHAVELLPDLDNNSDTTDIMLFDNGGSRFILNSDVFYADYELYSRLVHYRINEVTMEVEQIWEYGQDRGYEIYSQIMGDADLQDNGNILGTFPEHRTVNGVFIGNPLLIELSPDDEIIWEAEILSRSGNGGIYVYATDRVDVYVTNDQYQF